MFREYNYKRGACEFCGTKEGLLAMCYYCGHRRCANCDCTSLHKEGMTIRDRPLHKQRA